MSTNETQFYLPDAGNMITSNDIDSGTLRITVVASGYFKREKGTVTVCIEGEDFQATYIPRVGRSDLLRLGKAAMAKLGLKPGNRLCFRKINFSRYTIDVV